MVRTPCRDAGANSPQQPGGSGKKAKSRQAGGVASDEDEYALPPCLEGSRSLEFVATKKAAVPGRNGGSWTISAHVRLGRKTIFERRSSLVFGLSDDIAARDAECQEQLRTELGEVWQRMTCSPKESCRIGGGREFKGTRYVKIVAKKWRKGKNYLWTCNANAQTDYAGFSRVTTCDYVAEADASRGSAAALLLEIVAVWQNATRGENETYNLDFECASALPPLPDQNDENEPPGHRGGTMRFIRDVYGASSNVDAVVNRTSRI